MTRLYPAATARHQYAMRPGQKPAYPGATTIAKLASDMGGLPWGAAKETALFAVHHQDEWMSLPTEAAVERLRRHFQGVWDAKRDRGTVVHDLALAWANGQEVDVPEDCDPYMDALERFWDENQPEWVTCERAVVHDVEGLEYGGRFDWIARMGAGEMAGAVVLGDYKTGGRYPIEVTLQLAGYRYATGLAVVDAEGLLTGVEPLPEIDACCSLYLHDDGTYELLELPVDEGTHEVFLQLRRVWAWNKAMAAWEKAHPAPKAEEAAA